MTHVAILRLPLVMPRPHRVTGLRSATLGFADGLLRRGLSDAAAKPELKPSQVHEKALCFSQGMFDLLVIAIDLKPPNMFIDRCRRLMDLTDDIADLSIGFELGCAGHVPGILSATSRLNERAFIFHVPGRHPAQPILRVLPQPVGSRASAILVIETKPIACLNLPPARRRASAATSISHP